MSHNVNFNIAITHIITRKKQTLVAALGVTIGVSVFLFMNSLSSGFSSFSRNEIFKNSAHIKIFKDDEVSSSFAPPEGNGLSLVVNPQITTLSDKIVDPGKLINRVKEETYVLNAMAQVAVDIFYKRGKSQIKGSGNGVNITEYNDMFNLQKYIVAGDLNSLSGKQNGIIIGSGIAEKFNLGLNDNITVASSFGVSKTLKITGIFKTGSSLNDNTKSYFNLSLARQLVKEGPSYVSTIFIKTPDPDHSEVYMKELQQLTPYKVEDWKTTNADVLAGDKTRNALMMAISFSILVVASFGIYNILSATIAQKINDIAILKATGYSGKDVVRIFLFEALIMGIIGTIAGLLAGAVLIAIMSGIYMGGHVGYFPIEYELPLFTRSLFLGLIITLCAGYFPARKAARVDPVEIFRR